MAAGVRKGLGGSVAGVDTHTFGRAFKRFFAMTEAHRPRTMKGNAGVFMVAHPSVP
jgi:hypothetical protein